MKLYQKTLMLLCTLCLVFPLLAVRAKAAEPYVVDGIFCYEDSNGQSKIISNAKVDVSYAGNNNIGCTGEIKDGVLTLDRNDSLYDGMYIVTAYWYPMLSSTTIPKYYCQGQLDASRTDGIWKIGEKAIDEKIVFPLKIYISFTVFDAQTQEPIANAAWKLQKGGTLLDSGTTYSHGDGYARELTATHHNFGQGQYQLVLQKEGYQDAVYEFHPVIDSESSFRWEPYIDFSSLRMVPEGVIAQPTPKDLRFSNGRLSWTPTFVNDEGADCGDDHHSHFSKLDLRDLLTEYTYTYQSIMSGSSFNIFSNLPDWPSGEYIAKVTAEPNPYYSTVASEPTYLIFHYNKPNGYLPKVTAPAWKAGNVPILTWGYDPELLKCVKEFRVFPRVAATADGWDCDFIHEYIEDWEDGFTVAPSQDGSYSIPQLEEVMKGYGEGWYTFEVQAVSGSEQWGDSNWVDCSERFHYIPNPDDPVINGTMVDFYVDGFTRWSLDNVTRRFKITKTTVYSDDVDGMGKLWLVTYDKNGRASKIQNIRQNESADLSRADSARLFWLTTDTFDPISLPADIISVAQR